MALKLWGPDKYKLNVITLSFAPELEQEFLQEYFEKSLKHVRTAMLLAIFFYGFFGILDAAIFPQVKEKIWIIRYALFIPFTFSVFFLSYSRYFQKFWQMSTAAIILFAGIGIVQMIIIAPYPANSLYYAGLILVFIYGYTFFKLRFIWATFAGWMIIIAYEVTAGRMVDTPFHIFLSNNFFFLTGNCIGMFACYSIELYSRKYFIKTRLLEAEKRKVNASNHELEKKVKERTEQLVIINDDLRKEVAERRFAEKTAKENESKFKCLSENSPEIVYTLEYEGSFNYVNPAWEKILGHKVSEVKGKYFIDFALKKDAGNYVGLFKRIRNRRETLTNAVGTLIHKDGSQRLFNLSGAPNLDDDGNVTGMVGLLKDITDQHKLQTQLFQAQKMEALGILAGGVAHDFNNILFAIMGNTELASMQVGDNAELNNNIDQILKASQRARELVSQILSFSPHNSEKLKPVEVRIIAKEVLKLLRASLPSTIDIEQEIDPESGIIEADPTQIHQLLMNLCTNAAAAMGAQGGSLQINLRNEQIDTCPENMYLDIEPGFYVVLRVRDTGPGMVPDILGKIFDPYFTTKEKGKGTGLGLAVVHGILKGMGGGIAVDTAVGAGTTFRVYFPVLEAEPAKDRDDVDQTLPEGDECILFVDDEKEILNVGSQMLSRLGYEVITKSNSIEGLDLFKAHPERFDLVITDMTMPNLTGDRLASELMKVRPDIPIILCTGYSENIDEEQARKIGIKEFSMKPLRMSSLAKATRKVLDGIELRGGNPQGINV